MRWGQRERFFDDGPTGPASKVRWDDPQGWIDKARYVTGATDDALRGFCRERMAHFKVPHAFTPVTELPKTATGKIQKFVLRKGRANINAQ